MKKQTCTLGFFLFMVAGLTAVPGNAGTPAGNEDQTNVSVHQVSIDYLKGLIIPFGRIELAKGETLKILVFNLPEDAEKYEFGVLGLVESIEKRGAARTKDLGPFETLITIIHDSAYQSYRVTVRKRESGETLTWFIPVFTHAWTLDFSGAFTFDWLINPLYYLEPGTQADPNQNVPRNGFFIRRNTKGEDAVGLGAAAMVHLYHTKYLHFLKKTFAWAPLSFGLGVGVNTETRYYLGTSVRVGDVLFLTAGAVFGKVDRLPANLAEGGFVAEANALGTLPRRSTAAVFIGISYAFAGKKAKEQLEQAFSMSNR